MSNIRSNQMKKQQKVIEMGGSGLALEQVAAKASKSKASNSEFAFFGNGDCADSNSIKYPGMLYMADASGPEQCEEICTTSSCLSGLRGFSYSREDFLSTYGCGCYVDHTPTLDLPGECECDDGLLAYRSKFGFGVTPFPQCGLVDNPQGDLDEDYIPDFDGTGEVMNTIPVPSPIECWKVVPKSKAAKTSSTQAQVGQGISPNTNNIKDEGKIDPPSQSRGTRETVGGRVEVEVVSNTNTNKVNYIRVRVFRRRRRSLW